MDKVRLADKVVVVTGGASGIGAALALQFKASGAHVCISDRDATALEATSKRIGCAGVACDVTVEADILSLIDHVTRTLGPIDIFVSNAGIISGQQTHVASASNENWLQNWSVHVMAHVFAARALLPQMLARGEGYFINITSAAGLLNQIGDAAYSASKHAAVSFSESLLIEHGSEGIGVSVVCPQYVATPLIGLGDADADHHPSLLSADEVASVIISGMKEGHFLITPHPEVRKYARNRAIDHDGWIKGMQRLRAKADDAKLPLQEFYTLV
jgi:NAD(P)-dependent dehydrogenase (short-subunit alcohol dehydrogenase family)